MNHYKKIFIDELFKVSERENVRIISADFIKESAVVCDINGDIYTINYERQSNVWYTKFEDDEYDNACREYEEAYKKYKRAELKFKHINYERFVKKAVEAVKGTIER